MYCARCGGGLGEEKVCGQCGWSFGEVNTKANISAEQLARPSTGDGAAIASLVCGILSWISFGGGGIIPICGIIFGMIGLKSRRSEVAVAGIVINAGIFILAILAIMMFAILAMSAGPSAGGSHMAVGGRCC